MSEWQRYSAVEYSRPARLAEEISTGSRIPIGRAMDLLSNSAARVRRLLRLEASPVSWIDGGGTVSECCWDSARGTAA